MVIFSPIVHILEKEKVLIWNGKNCIVLWILMRKKC